MPTQNAENLGPAEHIIQSIINHVDHLYHGRPGMVVTDNRTTTGVKWFPTTTIEENNQKVVYKLIGRNNKQRVGILRDNGDIYEGPRKIGEYRAPGLFSEVAVYLYRKVAEVYKLDNEFAAKWASYAFKQDYQDLKVILAAFMLVQNRCGEPITENGKLLFKDDDFRDVGEAMILLYGKGIDSLKPKYLLRIHEILSLPQIAEINRELGFGNSVRKPALGRYNKVVTKWLRYREKNLPLLQGLVKGGMKKTVKDLSRKVGYKPETTKFFELLRWKQSQAKDGHRTLAIGNDISVAESWTNLTEKEICEKIVKDKPNYKRIVGLIPSNIGLTRAILAASIEAGSLSNKDLVINTPTIEELGLLNVPDIKLRWERAVQAAEDMRAANIAKRVKSDAVKETLQEGADTALKAAVEEAVRDITIYLIIDISGSMTNAIETAKEHLKKFVQAFPQDKIHISVFNTTGKEVTLRHFSSAGVDQAFRGIRAGGGTDYGAGVRILQNKKPTEGDDVIFIFVGDEGAADFHTAVTTSGLNPTAFGLIKVTDPRWPEVRFAVQNTANRLGIPCFKIEEDTFEDPYAVPRTIRNLIASTPVGTSPSTNLPKRKTLVDQILETPVLTKPTWSDSL